MNEYLQTKGIWIGIAVLIIVAIIGMVLPAALLPYPVDYYDDKKTKLLLMTSYSVSLTLIFGYLIVYLSVIFKKINGENLSIVYSSNVISC